MIRVHPERATPDTKTLLWLWNIWSQWRGDMTWPTKWQWQRKLHLDYNIKEQSKRIQTIETLITFLTIEKNNLNINSDSSIKSDMGQHSQFFSCNVYIWLHLILWYFDRCNTFDLLLCIAVTEAPPKFPQGVITIEQEDWKQTLLNYTPAKKINFLSPPQIVDPGIWALS